MNSLVHPLWPYSVDYTQHVFVSTKQNGETCSLLRTIAQGNFSDAVVELDSLL